MFTDTLLDLFMTKIAPGLYIAAVFLWGLFYVAWKLGKVKVTVNPPKLSPLEQNRFRTRSGWVNIRPGKKF